MKYLRLVVYREEDYEDETLRNIRIPIFNDIQEIPYGIDNEGEFIKYLYFRFAKELEIESRKQ